MIASWAGSRNACNVLIVDERKTGGCNLHSLIFAEIDKESILGGRGGGKVRSQSSCVAFYLYGGSADRSRKHLWRDGVGWRE